MLAKTWVWDGYPLHWQSFGDQPWPFQVDPKPGRVFDLTFILPVSRVRDPLTGETLSQQRKQVSKPYYIPTDEDRSLLKRLYPTGDIERPNWLKIKADLMVAGHTRDDVENAEVTLILALAISM